MPMGPGAGADMACWWAGWLLVLAEAWGSFWHRGCWSPGPRRLSGWETCLRAQPAAGSAACPRASSLGCGRGHAGLAGDADAAPPGSRCSSEVHFFNVEENYQRGLGWYRQQMPLTRPSQLTLEKTPGYFSSLQAPERIHAMDPSVRLLLIVRDPVERLVSDYTQVLHNRQARRKPYPALEQLLLLRGQELNTSYKAIQRSLYALHLARWLAFFPLAQIHVVDGGSLIREPLGELRRVEHFLGLMPWLGPDNFYFNQTKGFYCLQAGARQRCLDESKGRPHPPIPELVLEQLCTYFSAHNEHFFSLVGRTFNWC